MRTRCSTLAYKKRVFCWNCGRAIWRATRDWLRAAAQESIPRLAEAYARLRDLHAAQWEATRKRNGWEVMALRYGAVLGRLEDVRRAIARYADGELSELCELEETPLPNARKGGMQFYSVYVSPVYSL